MLVFDTLKLVLTVMLGNLKVDFMLMLALIVLLYVPCLFRKPEPVESESNTDDSDG